MSNDRTPQYTLPRTVSLAKVTVMVWYNSGSSQGTRDCAVRFWGGLWEGFEFWPGATPDEGSPGDGHFGAVARYDKLGFF